MDRRQKKQKHLRMTATANVFLNDGDTSYSISLDALDIALLPMDKLLNKYSGNQQTAIWSLDTYLKEVESLDEWDELCEFEVQAIKRPDPVKDCIFCHICQLNVPKNHIEEHNDSEGHGAMLQMAFRATDRINKHMIQEKKSDSIVNVQSAEQSYYYCATCNMFVDLSDTNHHNEAEHRTSLKRHKLHIKFYEKYEQLGGGEIKSLDTIELKVEDVKEKPKPKETHKSHENTRNIKKQERQKPSGTKSVNNSCFCSVCDMHIPNTKKNINEHFNGKIHRSNIVRNEEHKTETASKPKRACVLVPKSYEAMTNSNVVGTASVTRNNTTARSIQNNSIREIYLPNAKHNINEHSSGKTHKSNIVINEEHKTETASEARRAGVLVSKSHEAMTNSNVVGTASVTRNNTAARSIQNSSICDIYMPNANHNIDEHVNGKRLNSNIVRNEEHKTETASETIRVGMLVPKSYEAKNSNVVGNACATRNNTTARSIQNSILCDTYVPNTKHNLNEHVNYKTQKNYIVRNEEHKTETASVTRLIPVTKSLVSMTNSNVVGTAFATRHDTTARSIQNSNVCDTYVPNTKHNINEHSSGKTHKSNIVINEEHKTETASEARRAGVLVSKSHEAMTNSNVVGTASASRNGTTAQSIQNSRVCDTNAPNTKHNINEHVNGKRLNRNIVRNEEHKTETASETIRVGMLVPKSNEAMTNSNVVGTASATRNNTTARSIQNSNVCDTYVPNTKHNINEHSSGKTHRSNIVINEEHKTETASEARRAGVLVSKSHEAMTNSNVVGTASASRIDTTARSIQNSRVCDTYVPKHNVNERNYGKGHNSNIKNHDIETVSETSVLVTKLHETNTNSSVVGTAGSVQNTDNYDEAVFDSFCCRCF